jgi:hypothetical protein
MVMTGCTLVTIVASVLAGGQPPSLLQRSAPFEGEWRITLGDHFDFTFTTVQPGDLERIAAMAERAYRRVGASLSHDLSLKPLIVVYPTRADRQRAMESRTFPGNREHLLWALDTPAADADGDFVHELTHVFAFDIVPARRNLPLWFQEGLAEFQRGEWKRNDLELVRDLLRTNAFPALGRLSRNEGAQTDRVRTVVGHLAIDFLTSRRGPGAVTGILHSLQTGAAAPFDVYLASTGMTETAFDREFERYAGARARF